MTRSGSILDRLGDQPHRTLALLFALCVAVYLATIPIPRVDGMLIGSDGIGYYMYVRSLVIDRDLDMTNEYALLRPDVDVAALATPTGLTGNQYAVGPSLLWSPFFVVGHLVAMMLRQAGLPVEADGYGYVYQAAVCLGSMVYGFGGILLIYATARRFYPRTALATALLIWLGTNLIYYLVVEPSMSHMCSLFATALLVHVWIRSRPSFSVRHCFAIGLAGGLAGVVRQPDATLLLLPVLDMLLFRGPARLTLRRLAAVSVGFAAIFSLQMVTWNVLYGSPFSSGYFYEPGQGFSWLSPHLAEVLFSTEHGLFLWHPILLFGLLGLARFHRTDRALSLLALAGIGLQAYIIASWSSWSQADSFGGRMFIGSLPLFALGLAAFLEWASDKRAIAAAWAASAGLIVWNALFLLQYRLGFISMSGPYTLRQLTVGKLGMLAELVRRVMDLTAR